MQISLFLDRFHVQAAARAQLHPLDDFCAWSEITHAAAITAAGAIQAFAPLCGAAGAAAAERSAAALDALRAGCATGGMPLWDAVAVCEAAFADVQAALRASCNLCLM